MKRFFCLLITLLIVSGSVTALDFKSSGAGGDTIDIDAFSRQVREMLAGYPVDRGTAAAASGDSSDGNHSGFETMRLIVKSERKIDTLDAVSVISGYKNLWILQFDSPGSAQRACGYYAGLDCVEYAEPDSIVKAPASPVSLSAKKAGDFLSWGAGAADFDEALKYLEAVPGGLNEVTAGIIDSGVDCRHEFLKDRMLDEGLNFSASGDDTGMSDDPDSHGTHVAGIIADCTPGSVRLRSYKIFDSLGETTDSAIVSAVDKAVSDKVDIINCSFCFSGSEAVRESIENACKSGAAVVSAAGNDGIDCRDLLPCALDEVITVGACDKKLRPADFSNYGSSLDILAPGVDIFSTVDGDEYGLMSGTSMAAPFVSAGCAILFSLNPGMTAAEAESRLKSGAIPVDGAYPEAKTGQGILNICEAIDADRLEKAVPIPAGGTYTGSVSVEFTQSPGTKIYYTTNGTLPGPDSGILYSAPFVLTDSCRIISRVYSDDDSILCSKLNYSELHIFTSADESDFTVSQDGELLGYLGSAKSVTVPEKVNGITVTSVGKNAFDGESGADFEEIILPGTVTEIRDSAFASNQNIKYVSAESAVTVGEGAFRGCTALFTFDAPAVRTIKAEAFKGCTDFTRFNSYAVKLIDDYAFEGVKGIRELTLDKLKGLGVGAFKNSNLEKVSFSALDSFKENEGRYCSGAFYGCRFLREVYMPALKEWGVYSGTERSCSGLESLRVFYAPGLAELGAKAFYGCTALENVNIENVRKINNEAFRYCESLKELDLPAVREIGKDVFQGSGLEYVYFGALEKCEAYFTKSCSVVIPSSASALMFDSGEIGGYISAHGEPPVHITVYGTAGSYAEEWAESSHENCTSEFIAVPLIESSVPPEISESEEKLAVDAVGFNLSYQWYGSVDGTAENSVILSGETGKELDFGSIGRYSGYFCVVTGRDGNTVTSVTSDVVRVIYTSADYSRVYEALAAVPSDLSVYTPESVENLQSIIDGIDYDLDISAQEQADEYAAQIKQAVENLKKEFWLIRFFRKLISFFKNLF